MPDFLAAWPFWVTFVVLYLIATARGQAVYWASRVVTEQALRRTHPTSGWRRSLHTWLAAGGADAGITALRRWGLVAVPVSYLTVGLQSMVQAGAGVLRISWPRYSLAQVPGALAWAVIYSTIGWAVWDAAISATAGSTTGLAVLALVVLGVLGVVVHRRRRARPPQGSPAPVAVPAREEPPTGR